MIAFNGYYNRDDLNTEIFQNGYFKTGDLGFIYRDKLFLTGRIKDIIISNGVNIYPHDVEAILNNTASLSLEEMLFLELRMKK